MRVELSQRRRVGAHSGRAAMDAVVVWVMLVTPTTLANPYTVEEVCAFLARDTLMPVFVRVRLGDFAAAANACCRGAARTPVACGRS
jgi:hypothetical protein